MASIKVQNINGAKPQHVRDDTSARTIASSIIQQVSTSNREVVNAMSQIQQSGLNSMMNSLDMKNVKTVDLILGRMASLLEEQFTQMKLSDISQLKTEILQQMSNLAINQLSKADKAELMNGIASYFDKKINMKQLEMQLADLNMTVNAVKQSLNSGQAQQTSGSTSSNYQTTLLAVDSAINKLNLSFSSISSTLSSIIRNQQLVIDNMNNMFNTLSQIYAMVDKIDTKQTWDMIQPYVQPIFKSIAKNVFGFIGLDKLSKSFEEDLKILDTTSDFAKVHKHIDTAAMQTVDIINNFASQVLGDSYKKIDYKPNAPQLRQLTKLESLLVMVKGFFTDKSHEELTKEYLLGDEDNPYYKQNLAIYNTVKKLEKSNRDIDNKLLEAQHLDMLKTKQSQREQVISERQIESTKKNTAKMSKNVEKTNSMLSGFIDKSKSMFNSVTGFFSDMFSAMPEDKSKDNQPGQKKERSILDNIVNFFKALANLFDWVANGSNAKVNMWEHFGIGGLPRIISTIDTLLHGSDKDRKAVEDKIGGAINGLLGQLTAFFNNKNVASMIQVLNVVMTKENLAVIDNIMKSADRVMNSKMMNVIADKFSESSKNDNETDNKGFLGKLSSAVNISKLPTMISSFFESLKPFFGNEKGQFDTTEPMINNIVKVLDTFPIEKVINIADALNKNIDIINEFVDNIGILKNKLIATFGEGKEEPLDEKFNKINKILDEATPILEKSIDIAYIVSDFLDSLKTDKKGNFIIFKKLNKFTKQFNDNYDSISSVVQSGISLYNQFVAAGIIKKDEKEKSESSFSLKNLLDHIDNIIDVLDKIEEKQLFTKIQPLFDFINKNVENIQKTEIAATSIFNIYKKYKDTFGEAQQDGNKNFADEAVSKINDFNKIIDALISTKLIEKLNTLSDSLFKEDGVLNKLTEVDKDGKNIFLDKIDKLFELKDDIKKRFGLDENKEGSSGFNADEIIKSIDNVSTIVDKISQVLDIIENKKILDRLSALISKIMGIVAPFTMMAGMFGGKNSDKSSEGFSITSLTKLVDSITVALLALNKTMQTFDKSSGPMFKMLKQIIDTIEYAKATTVDLVNVIVDKINDVINTVVKVINVAIIRTINNLIGVANKAIRFIPGMDYLPYADNIDASGWTLDRVNKESFANSEQLKPEIVTPDLIDSSKQSGNEQQLQEIVDAKEQLQEEVQNSTEFLNSISTKLQDIQSILNSLLANVKNIDTELNGEAQHNIKEIQKGISAAIALTGAKKDNATSTEVSDD